MFKSEAQKWIEMQPKHTQEWMKKQAIWHDADMIRIFTVGIIMGLLIGLMVGVTL